MTTPHELLDQVEADLARANHDEAATGLDRRAFVFRSLVAAAATTFGATAAQAQRVLGGADGTVGEVPAPLADLLAPERVAERLALRAQPQLPELGNGESPALQFQPWPGGPGAAFEHLLATRGRDAFERGTFPLAPWSGPVPTDPDDIAFLPAHRQAALIRERRLTSTRLTEIYLARLERLDPTLLCAVTILRNQALAEAARADAELAAGRWRGPLHGLPYGLKDLFSTKGIPTTWGAPDFKDRVIDEDAEIVVRLREAGAVLVAKLSTGLFAQNDQWFRGRTNNPWNLAQGASGSSAGPGSATAAGCVSFSIGTETQGSIVSPSIRNGISALRPTFGRVSRHGGMVLAWSMDRVGPMCRTVEDCAMVFHVIHGVDEKDPGTITAPFQYDRDVDLRTLRIGVDANAPKPLVDGLRALGLEPREIGARPSLATMGGSGLNVEYAAAFDAYVQRKAREIGLDLSTVTADWRLPAPPAGTPPDPMAPADWHNRFVRGRVIPAFEFLQQQRRRYLLVSQWGAFMKELDGFIGAPSADVANNAQTGHPCVVLPYAFDVPGSGRPPGNAAQNAPAQPTLKPQPICGVITGALYNDDRILSLAHRFQASTDFHTRRPAL
jgi:Asp-tRNA(Asn)/Glu-tRNA(Gln) amidotransferase A subunit family amidase